MLGLLFALPCLRSSATAAGILDEAGRPASPEEARQLRARIDSLQRETGLARTTIAAIANRLGTSPAVSTHTLLTRLDAQTRQAVDMQQRIKSLEAKLNALDDPLLRDPALAHVRKAEAAFQAGRLEEAEAALGELEYLRRANSFEAVEAWLDAVLAEAKAAELQGGEKDFDRAYSLEREAREVWRKRSKTIERRLSLAAMQQALREAQFFGRARGLERAIGIYHQDFRQESDMPDEAYVPSLIAYVTALRLQARQIGGEAAVIKFNEAQTALDRYLREHKDAIANIPEELVTEYYETGIAKLDVLDAELMPDNGHCGIKSNYFDLVTDTFQLTGPGSYATAFQDAIKDPSKFSLVNAYVSFIYSCIDRPDFVDLAPAFKSKNESTVEFVENKHHREFDLIKYVAVVSGNYVAHKNENNTAIDKSSDVVGYVNMGLIAARSYYRALVLLKIAPDLLDLGVDDRDMMRRAIGVIALTQDAARVAGLAAADAQLSSIRGSLALLAVEMPDTSKKQFAEIARESFEAAIVLQKREDQPLEWSESTLGLARAQRMLAELEGTDSNSVCIKLQSSYRLMSEGLAVQLELLPKFRTRAASEELRTIETLAADCGKNPPASAPLQ